MLTYIYLSQINMGEDAPPVTKQALDDLGFECLEGWWRKTARISVEKAVEAAFQPGENRIFAVKILASGIREAKAGMEPLIRGLTLLASSQDQAVAKVARSALKRWKNNPEVFRCLTQGKEERNALRNLNILGAQRALRMNREVLKERWITLIS
jgi:hypothetical protein